MVARAERGGGRRVTPRHGIVLGKFYPPHAGHHLLVRTASRVCERVTVVVMAASVESLPLDLRVSWMREVHAAEPNVRVAGIADDLPIDYEDDAIWRGHVALVREALARSDAAAPAVDGVFTSETYGAELARRLGARNVLVDLDRSLVPVSASAVRADPVAHWSTLAACVRAHLAVRVVIVGAESTGKTTLAAALAERLRARGGAWGRALWVPEVGRDVTIDKLAEARARAALEGRAAPRMEDLVWATGDFVAIARAQAEAEARAAAEGGPVVVCDTDAFATGVWHERYVGTRSAAVEALSSPARREVVLLTHPDDVPFHQDGLRDGASVRKWMTETFVQRLDDAGRPWQWLRGSRAERLARAERAVDALVAEGLRLAPPLG